MTGGVNGGVHVTDITNASRTMLMNLETGEWDEELCRLVGRGGKGGEGRGEERESEGRVERICIELITEGHVTCAVSVIIADKISALIHR